MDVRLLFNADGPALAVLVVTPSTLADLLMSWTGENPEWAVRRIRGEKSSDETRFFDEVAAALQFPYYFGENWDAFAECIRDLSWLWRPNFLLVFDGVEHLLAESDERLSLLLGELAAAHDHWRDQRGSFGSDGMRPVAFQSVLACAPSAAPAFDDRMKRAGIDFARI
jgi:hypothetical protein